LSAEHPEDGPERREQHRRLEGRHHHAGQAAIGRPPMFIGKSMTAV